MFYIDVWFAAIIPLLQCCNNTCLECVVPTYFTAVMQMFPGTRRPSGFGLHLSRVVSFACVATSLATFSARVMSHVLANRWHERRPIKDLHFWNPFVLLGAGLVRIGSECFLTIVIAKKIGNNHDNKTKCTNGETPFKTFRTNPMFDSAHPGNCKNPITNPTKWIGHVRPENSLGSASKSC